MHHATNPNPRLNLLSLITNKSGHVMCKNACWSQESDNCHTNPSVSQPTHICTNHYYPNLCSFPANEPPNLHTQKHATSNKPSCTLNVARPNIHVSTILTSHHQKENSAAKKHKSSSRHLITAVQAWNLICKARNGPKKHEISSGNLVISHGNLITVKKGQ